MMTQQGGIVQETVYFDKNPPKAGIKGIVKGLRFLLCPTWKYGRLFLISSLILSVIQPLTSIITIIFQKKIIDTIAEKSSLSAIAGTIAAFAVVLILLPLISHFWTALYRERKQNEINSAINKEIYQKSISTDFRFFDDPEFFNSFTWTVSQYSTQSEAAHNILLSFAAALFGITALTAVMIENDALIILFTVIALFATNRLKLRLSKVNYKKMNEMLDPQRKKDYIHRTMYQKEYIAGLKSTKASDILMEKYDDAVSAVNGVIKRFMYKRCLIDSLIEIINSLLYFIIVTFLGYRIVTGKLSIGSFTAMLTASSVLRTYLGNFVDITNKSQEAVVFAQKIRSFFELESAIENHHESGINVPEGPMDIELKNVSFRYANSQFAMKNLNMKIRSGSKIAIVGENGTGKTTLVKLLLRLYDVENGEILVNNVPIKQYKVKELRQNIGIAFQDAPMYALSVADNMAIYNKADNSFIYRIFEIFGLDKVLKKSNSNLDSDITREFDKNGLVLSGGEKQKLALARLFTKNFGLFILDEPTSALDPLAEYELNKIIFNRSSETTTIMVSHRLSTIRDADCIYLFKDGEISESGTHDKLMQLHGKYYEMFTKQAENYIDKPEEAINESDINSALAPMFYGMQGITQIPHIQ